MMDSLRLQLDRLHPTARHWVALGTAFFVQSWLRSFCITSSYVFGDDLRENLGPLERSDISYGYILGVRLIDLVAAIYVWRREAGGHRARADAPLLGMLLSLVSRVPLYLLLSHHFLLSYKTLSQLLVTDVFASAVAMWIISQVEPKRTSFFRAPPGQNSPLGLDVARIRSSPAERSKLEMAFYALGTATLANALYSYIAERAYLTELIRRNVVETHIPAYLSALKPAAAEAMAHPTIAVPILRSAIQPLSMPAHLVHALPLSLGIAALALVYLPQKAPAGLAALLFALVAPSNALTVYNLLPVKFEAASTIGIENGFKAAAVAYILAWVTDDWRRPGGKANSTLKEVSSVPSETVIVGKDSITFRETLDPDAAGEVVDDTKEFEVIE